jgi:hypothetical protein
VQSRIKSADAPLFVMVVTVAQDVADVKDRAQMHMAVMATILSFFLTILSFEKGLVLASCFTVLQ